MGDEAAPANHRGNTDPQPGVPAGSEAARAKSLANLAPAWPPGQSGNPKGRPVKRPITDAIEQVLERGIPEDIARGRPELRGKKMLDLVAEQIVRHVIKGNAGALKEMYERIEGKMKQVIAHEGEDGQPLGPVNINILIAKMQSDPELAKVYLQLEERISAAALDARGADQPAS